MHDGDKVAHVGSKHPSALIKCIGRGQRDAEDAHHQVDEGQVADEKIGRVVSFLIVPDEEEQEEVARARNQDHSRVERDEDELQVKQEVEPRERGG